MISLQKCTISLKTCMIWLYRICGACYRNSDPSKIWLQKCMISLKTCMIWLWNYQVSEMWARSQNSMNVHCSTFTDWTPQMWTLKCEHYAESQAKVVIWSGCGIATVFLLDYKWAVFGTRVAIGLVEGANYPCQQTLFR